MGCPSEACSEKPGAWCALRFNSAALAPALPSASASSPAAPAATAASGASWASAPVADDAWGGAEDAGGWGDAGGGEWGEAEAAPQQPPPAAVPAGKGLFGGIMEASQAVSATGGVSGSGDASLRAAAPQFRCRKLVAYDDPLQDPPSRSGGSDDRIKALYEKYLASDLAQEDASKLPAQLSSSGGGDSDDDDDEGAETGGKTAKAPGVGMFHRALAASPQQVMRYAFEGGAVLPKGCLLDPPPACGGCGGPRVFELQLMPALLQALDVDAGATVSGAVPGGLLGDVVVGGGEGGGGAAAHEDAASDKDDTEGQVGGGAMPQLAVLGGGMDWGSVLVYSCAASCGKQGEEFVQILPAHAV